MGKTSILNLIEGECEINNIIPFRIDLTEANSLNSSDFFWHLFSQCINKFFTLGLFDGKGGAIDSMIQNILNSDGLIDQANWVFKTPILRKNYLLNQNQNFEFPLFIEDLRLMRKEVIESKSEKFNDHTKFLFLVDESQHIYSNKKIVEEIRFVLQSQELGIGFAFSGDSTYKTAAWEEVFGGSYRDFEIINLPYFTDVDSVIDFFKKSLSSINWTDEEIEETLFYRFKLACRNIFRLTSGKPAWINVIASKMFERCMSGEVKQMKFDKQAQTNVKKMLEDSGDLDITKLDFIEHLPSEEELWLAEIFASELRTFNQVYFYAKFKLSNENFLNLGEYETFCKKLVSRKIISLIGEDENNFIGFKLPTTEINFLDRHYYAFDLRSDTIKQWLQINSEGKYSFKFESPSLRFMKFINDELVTEKFNTVIITHPTTSSDEKFRLLTTIEKINHHSFDINDETFENLSLLFKACKRIEDSKEKQILYVELKNELSGKVTTWNIYNYNDKDRIIGYRESPSTIIKIRSLVIRFNNDAIKYEIEIFIDKIQDSNLNVLESLIIKSGDGRKIGIILEDKMDDLLRLYVKESNVESSFEIASFFYRLFDEGHDLRLKDLNNTAYVFIEKNELEKASTLLNEAKRKIIMHTVAQEDLTAAGLVFYNLGILEAINNNFKASLKEFENLIDFMEINSTSGETASILKFLELKDEKIQISETKEGKRNYSKLKIKEFAQKNIDLLTTYC
ncbi:MAG: hypothetical protein ACHQF0_15790 [Chitinophagales bacterium]